MSKTRTYFLTGTYTEPILFGTGELVRGKGEGISLCVLEEDGTVTVLKCLKISNPSFLAIDEKRKHIYAVNEMKEFQGTYGGGLTDIVYDDEMNMRAVSSFGTGGTDPCHVAVSPDGRHVCCANFADGRVTVFPLDPVGNVLPEKTVYAHTGHGPDPARQKGPHAHSILFAPDGREMLVPDLGVDVLKAYAVTQTGILPDEKSDVALAAGSGPRAGEWSRDGKNLYIVHELDSGITHLRREDGKLKVISRVSTLDSGYSGENDCADIHLTPDGRYLYASNRGSNTIAIFRVEKDGSLTAAGHVPCGGRTPRNFAIDPSGRYLLSGNQDSDCIAVFAIAEDGQLKQVFCFPTPMPVCIRFFGESAPGQEA